MAYIEGREGRLAEAQAEARGIADMLCLQHAEIEALRADAGRCSHQTPHERARERGDGSRPHLPLQHVQEYAFSPKRPSGRPALGFSRLDRKTPH